MSKATDITGAISNHTISDQAYFIEVILPLSLPNTYTYRIKREEFSWIKIGQRVIVNFGKNKLYAALVLAIHQEIPNYSVKYIETILDEEPIISPLQLEWWKWISEYYCCPIGEIMLAALPAGLKLKSESKIVLHAHFNDVIDSIDATENIFCWLIKLGV